MILTISVSQYKDSILYFNTLVTATLFPCTDIIDANVSEEQLIESQLNADIASGRVLYYQMDKMGGFSVLYKEELLKQLRKVGVC